MATMNISLPAPMREWVEDQIASGMYSNNSDYVRDLIRKDQLRSQKTQNLQNAITAGLESGNAGLLDMQSIKEQARQQIGLTDKHGKHL